MRLMRAGVLFERASSATPDQGRGIRFVCPPQKFFSQCALFPKSPLNVLFLKLVTKNVHENQNSTSVS